MNKLNLAGQRVGRLTVISECGKSSTSGAIIWLCQCDCGNTVNVYAANLKAGITQSCGCYKKELLKDKLTTHGGTYSLEYSPWKAMRKRCSNPNDIRYPLYGGRGIKVCDRWNDFANFLSDMGPRPSHAHSIERINNNGNYEPDNCRWASPTEQERNTRGRKGIVPVNGVSWHKCTKKYIVQIGINGKSKYIGVFASLDEAKEARKQAEITYWGRERTQYEN